jgi:superoxide dismutase, Fe-Mn family
MAFELPDLPYAYDALQPYMSKETLEYHHDKHHQAYVTNGNNLLKGTGLEGKSVEEVVKLASARTRPLQQCRPALQPHPFLEVDEAQGRRQAPAGALQKAIDSRSRRLRQVPADFIAAGTTQFGSGWAWLSVKDGKLEISKTPNGENPLVHGATPILGVDVWEHSYYIDYRNARPKYLEAFVDNLINWDYVLEPRPNRRRA